MMSTYTIHSIMYYVIRNTCPPPIQIWPPRWPPQTAAARNATAFICHAWIIVCLNMSVSCPSIIGWVW